MYKYSKVVYKLNDGSTVTSLNEAYASKQSFTIEYIPVYENASLGKGIKERYPKFFKD